jgi:general stress protein YciG
MVAIDARLRDLKRTEETRIMAENRNQHDNWSRDQQGAKPESASKPGKRAYEERERDRASQIDKSHQDNARGDRNPGNFRNDPERASEAERKGGQR